MSTMWKVLTRRKVLDPATTEQTELGRVLNWFDLTALGVGSTLGVGVYVLAGHVAKDIAGPSVVLSFLLAAIASVFAGLCYAEFGARAPRAGSAYIYSYVCIGEFVAFVIGWNLILEYVIGSASVARGLSLYLDTLLNDTLQKTFTDIAPIDVSFMAPYFDFLAFGLSIFLAVALAFGMKESSIVNNVFTFLNLSVVLFVIIAGSTKADPKNWNLDPPANQSIIAGSGGFFPFGIEGMIEGAATCFYGFVGFDCIATTGEEVRNPQKAIPISIIISLLIIFLAYFGTSTVITLMVPYYFQDPDAPIPYAFEYVGWEWAKWLVAIGGLFGLCASLFGAMFPLPRIIYAMASDGLIFRSLGVVSRRFKTPVFGTIFAGTFTGLMGALFDLKQLVKMMSIGTLLAYTIVAASVLLLRYEVDNQVNPASVEDHDDAYTQDRFNSDREEVSDEDAELVHSEPTAGMVKQLFNLNRSQEPTSISEKLVSILIFVYCIFCICIGLCAIYLKTDISNGEVWAIVLTSIIVCLTILIVMSLATQPQSKRQLTFKVPFVPLIPILSILVNIYLMLMLDSLTWIRFGVWMAIGIPTYYFSVKNHYGEARNMSITSIAINPNPSEKSNGFINGGFVNDNQLVGTATGSDTVKSTRSVQVSSPEIESTIAEFDEIIEEASKSITRKSSTMTLEETISQNDNVLEEITLKNNDHEVEQVIKEEVQTEENITGEDLENKSDVSADSAIYEEIEVNEVATNENEAKENDLVSDDSVKQSDIIPPPPPLLPDFNDMLDISLPRPKFTVSEISSVKLRKTKKPAPAIPPCDYDYEHDNSDTGTELSDNLKSGTPEYMAFREKLNKNLQRQSTPVVNFLPKTDIKIVPIEHVPNENVIEELINKNEVKQKLTEFLEKSGRNSLLEPLPSHSEPEYDRKEEEAPDEAIVSNKSNTDSSEEERDLNQKSIRDSSVITDKEKHKYNMNGVLNSIKLRKVDSFKNNIEPSI